MYHEGHSDRFIDTCTVSNYNYRDNCDNKIHYRNNKNFIIAHP